MDEIMEKHVRIYTLLGEIPHEPLIKYLDADSDKLLDEKIRVLEALKAGKTVDEIPHFYDVLEDLPKDRWD